MIRSFLLRAAHAHARAPGRCIAGTRPADRSRRLDAPAAAARHRPRSSSWSRWPRPISSALSTVASRPPQSPLPPSGCRAGAGAGPRRWDAAPPADDGVSRRLAIRQPTLSVPELTYLDHAATTPMRPEAVEAMLPFLTERFANPSGSHRVARDARKAIDEARDVVAELLGVPTRARSSSPAAAPRPTTRGARRAAPSRRRRRVLGRRAPRRAAPGRAPRRPGRRRRRRRPRRPRRARRARSTTRRVGRVGDGWSTTRSARSSRLAAVAELVRGRARRARCCTPTRSRRRAGSTSRTIAPRVDLLSLSAPTSSAARRASACSSCATASTLEPLMLGGGQERERRSGTQNVAGIVAHGRGAARSPTTERKATDRPRRARCATGSSTGCSRRSSTALIETVARDRQGRRLGARLLRRRRERGAAVPARPGEACARSGARRAPAARWSRRTCSPRWACRRERALGALRLSLGRTTTEADVDRGARGRARQPVRAAAADGWCREGARRR